MRSWAVWGLLTVGLLIVAAASVFAINHGRLGLPFLRSFPTVNEQAMDADQRSVIEVLRREYDANPAGTKYSEGVKEPWCADFVSWVMRESGQPLSNPNSGSWRIPGVATLTGYYRMVGRFHPPEGYSPRPGDVVLYAPAMAKFGQHTNFVVHNDGGTLTTVGGNERGEIGVAAVDSHDPGIVGYGSLR
ncbi:MAG: CHAP domain-containing protein [Nocardiaceae bacterium]|nr:CHAP domain-containing protein [Nocardiaceae bacterium]